MTLFCKNVPLAIIYRDVITVLSLIAKLLPDSKPSQVAYVLSVIFGRENLLLHIPSLIIKHRIYAFRCDIL